MCNIYNQTVDSTDLARFHMFAKVNAPDLLPPTSDALKFHLMRTHYQCIVWKHSDIPKPQLPLPQDIGWRIENGVLVPILMAKDLIPEACIAMVKCLTCKTGCKNMRCGCCRGGLPCTGLCGSNKYNEQVTCINRI